MFSSLIDSILSSWKRKRLIWLFALIWIGTASAQDLSVSSPERKQHQVVSGEDISHFIQNIARNNPQFSQEEIYRNIEKKMLEAGCSAKQVTSRAAQYQFLREKITSILHHLDSLQDQALRQNLASFGIHGEQGYPLLATVSHQNRVRIMQKCPYCGSLPIEIEDLIESIQFQPGHFSQHGHEENRLPIFSSRVLRELGILPYGHNSKHRFNRELMQLDDNVFLFPLSYDLKGSTRYGNVPTFLDQEYAREKAWLSPTTMDPRHLIAWINPADSFPTEIDIEDEETVKILLEAKLKLKDFIFTFDDFVTTVKHVTKGYFETLQSQNPEELHRQVHALRSRNNVQMTIKAAWKSMGIPEGSGFELKVPVAVPMDTVF